MKYFKVTILVVLVNCFLLITSARAQVLQPGMIDMMPSMNTTMTNSINMSRTNILNGSNVTSERVRREQIGKQKIQAGKATTRFVSTEKGTEATIQRLTFESWGPQTFPEQLSLLRNYLRQFQEKLIQNNLKHNDYSDGFILAYLMSYEAYYNEKMSTEEFEKMKRNDAQSLLKASFFQGSPDIEKQVVYEMNVLMAMQAVEWRGKAEKAKSKKEEQLANERAKQYANYLLKVDK